MAQKLVLTIPTMTDDRSKQRAIHTVAGVYGVHSIDVELKESKMTVIGDMDLVVAVKKLRIKFRKVDIELFGPAKEEEEETPPVPAPAPAPAPAEEKKEEAVAEPGFQRWVCKAFSLTKNKSMRECFVPMEARRRRRAYT